MVSASVDLGGTRIKIGIVEDGTVAAKSSIEAFSGNGLAGRLDAVERELLRLIDESSFRMSDFGGIGISFPGIVDPVRKKVLSANGKYADATGIDLEGWCRERFGLGMILDNDANAALWGELNHGCGKGCDNAVLLIVGTGIGTAAVINGRLLRGKHYQAGCLGGHIAIQVNGRRCTCGNKGCLEANAGTWALDVIAREHSDFCSSGLSTEKAIDFLSLERWVRRGDILSTQLLKYFIDCWAAGVVNLIHAYDPELIVLSGGAMKCGDLILKPLTEKVHELAWTPWGKVRFELSKDPENSVLLGLYSLLEGEESQHVSQ